LGQNKTFPAGILATKSISMNLVNVAFTLELRIKHPKVCKN
jgi:hypothetical protein